MAFAVIHRSEVDDFRRSIADLGFDAIDFDLSETDTTQPTNSIFSIAGVAHVVRISIGATQSYPAGHGSAWPASFEIDLRRGVFGRP